MNVKKRKTIFITTFLVLVSILLTGCMVSKGSVERKAKRYLQKKYDEKFVFDSWGSSSSMVGGTTYTLYFCPQEHEDWKITVAWNDSWGKPSYVFTDNYLKYVHREGAEEILHQLIEPIYGECIVFLEIDGFTLPKEYEEQISPDFLLENSSNPITIVTSNKKEDRDYDFNLFKQAVVSKEYRIRAWIIYIREEEMEAMERNTVDSMFYKKDVLFGHSVISNGDASVRWRGMLE